MKPKLFFLFLVILFSSFVIAGRVGEVCDYAVNGDTECDISTNLYCIDRICAEYTGNPDGYCLDSDGNDEFTTGRVIYVFRTVSGAFQESMLIDECRQEGTMVTSCTTPNCSVLEYTCSRSSYSESEIGCTGSCDNGHCVVAEEPSPPAETTCDFSQYGDDECETENNYFCVEGNCTELTETPETFCNDSDDQNVLVKSTIEYSYRTSAGKVVQNSVSDACSGNYVKEYYCIDPLPSVDKVYDYNQVLCDGCSKGICLTNEEESGTPEPEPEEDSPPETISNQELLSYIDQWANGELGETEEENDAKIQEIIELWKNS